MSNVRSTPFDLKDKSLRFSTGDTHVITLLSGRGKRILVEDAFFHTDSSLFLPRGPDAGGRPGVDAPRDFSNDAFWDAVKTNNASYVETARDGSFVPPSDAGDDGGNTGTVPIAARGLQVVLAALGFMEAHPDHALVVAGHTDRVGSEAHNEELSDARAACVAAVLEGERSGYVAAARRHDKPQSDGNMLAFAAAARGFPCAPGDPTKPTPREIKAFQKAYNDDFGKSISVDGVVGDETRGAYFDVIDAELARRAGGEAALVALRSKLKFVDNAHKTLACGERFPVDRPDDDNVASQANRRVELLFFAPDLKPDLAAKDAPDRVYHKGTFTFEVVEPETLDAESPDDPPGNEQLSLADAPPPEDGVGEMTGALETEMAKLQDEPDLNDQYAFLEPFDDGFPRFGRQAIADVPSPGDELALA